MSTLLELDGPRLHRRGEEGAVFQLFRICFMGEADTGAPLVDASPDEATAGWSEKWDGETCLFTCQGRLVSQISMFPERLRAFDGVIRIGSIGGVCTHSDYRGHGLASRLLQYSAEWLEQRGSCLFLISGERSLYTRAGCVQAGRHAAFTLRKGQVGKPMPGVTLRPLTRADVRTGIRLYQAGPVHFERPLATYTEAFGHLPDQNDTEQWMVEMDGQPAAYLMLQHPWDQGPDTGFREVGEYAGSAIALAAGLAAGLDQPGIHSVWVHTPWHNTDLIHLLSERCGPPEWITLPGHTLRILNFPDLMADLRAYLRARLDPTLLRGLRFTQTGPLLGTEGGDQMTISRGKERLVLDGAAMTRLVMGLPDGEETPAQVSGALKEVVAALFPLPSFQVGLNFH